MNDLSQTNKSFDKFLVDSRSHIQDYTNTKYIKLQDFPNGKMLKVNRRNNLRYYRVYQKDELGCKSTLVDKSSGKLYLLTKIHKSRYSTEFAVNLNKYWKGTSLSFKGKHAQCFYHDLQFQKFDWCIFDLTSTNLGRIDLCYDRKLKETDKDLHLFFENSYTYINNKSAMPTVKLSNNILRIGKRSSSNFF